MISVCRTYNDDIFLLSTFYLFPTSLFEVLVNGYVLYRSFYSTFVSEYKFSSFRIKKLKKPSLFNFGITIWQGQFSWSTDCLHCRHVYIPLLDKTIIYSTIYHTKIRIITFTSIGIPFFFFSFRKPRNGTPPPSRLYVIYLVWRIVTFKVISFL